LSIDAAETVRKLAARLHDETLRISAIKARDPREPEKRKKEQAEVKLALIWRRIFRKQAEKSRQWLEQILPGLEQATKAAKKPKPPEWIWDLDEEDYQDLLDALEDAHLGGIDLFKASPAGAMGIDYTLVNSRAAAYARRYAFDLIHDIDDTSRQALQDAIEAFVKTPGMTVGDVWRSLPYDEQRAQMIATTEITRAYAEGNKEAGEEMQRQYPDVQVIEIWFTNNDEKVCDICGPLDGVEVPLDDPFPSNGGVDVFGEPLMRPPAHPNCRCWSSTSTKIK
jgi:hypothetical protein